MQYTLFYSFCLLTLYLLFYLLDMELPRMVLEYFPRTLTQINQHKIWVGEVYGKQWRALTSRQLAFSHGAIPLQIRTSALLYSTLSVSRTPCGGHLWAVGWERAEPAACAWLPLFCVSSSYLVCQMDIKWHWVLTARGRYAQHQLGCDRTVEVTSIWN